MLASALEFLVILGILAATDRPAYQSSDVLWAKPLVNLLLFLLLAIVTAPLPFQFLLFGLSAACVAAPLFVWSANSPLPLLILALGVATQATRALSAVRRQRFVVRLAPYLAALFATAAVATEGIRIFRERESPPQTAASDAPNVLLIILDTVRAASLFSFGGRAETPHLDSLAATGVVFERAITTAPWTLPSHATLFTGLWAYEHGADWRTPLSNGSPTLAELFSRAGYRTGGFVANLIYTSREHGLDRGFQVYRDYKRSPGAIFRAAAFGEVVLTSALVRQLTRYHEVAGRKSGAEVSREFLKWQDASSERPWFAFLNYFDAHEPWHPRPPVAGRYSQGLPPRRLDQLRFWRVEGGIANWPALTAAEVDAERAAYEETITELDAEIGAVVRELKRRGVLERTLVVVTSDHGEQFGEHELHSHGNSVYSRSIHVPLVIAWPGHLPSRMRITSPVSLRDLPATIQRVAGLQSSTALPGTPLLLPEQTRAAGGLPPLVLSELSAEPMANGEAMQNGSLQSVQWGEWQYVRAANGHEEVYRINAQGFDSLVQEPSLRSALVDTGRSLLSVGKVPRPAVRR